MQAALESEKDHSDLCQHSAEARLAAVTSEAAGLADALASARRLLAQTHSKCDAQIAEISRLQAACHAAEQEGDAHKRAASRLQTDADAAAAENCNLKAAEQTALAREAQVAEALADTQARLNSSMASGEHLSEQLRTSEARAESLEAQLAECHARADELDRADASQRCSTSSFAQVRCSTSTQQMGQ